MVVEASRGIGFPLRSPPVRPRPADAASDEDSPLVVDVNTNKSKAAALEQSILMVSSIKSN